MRQRFMRSCLVVCLGIVGIPAAPAPSAAAPTVMMAPPLSQSDARTVAALMARIGPPSPSTLEIFHEAGMTGARAHPLTAAEQERVRAVIALLPPTFRAALDAHLDRLSIVEGFAGLGNALTRRVSPEGAPARFEMTVRAEVLDEDLGALLTRKEEICFQPDAAGPAVRVEVRDVPALLYVLLHEATHVIEGSGEGAIVDADRLTQDVWLDATHLAPPFDTQALAQNAFRHAPRVPKTQADALYAALTTSPFISLYATASRSEYLAEMVAWAILSRRYGAPLTIAVDHAGEQPPTRYDPLANPIVAGRFAIIANALGAAP